MSLLNTLLLFSLAFFATLFGLAALLPVLREKHIGQTILEIGPSWHKGKEGTPTMGGVTFFFAVTLSVLLGCLFLPASATRALLWVLCFALFNGLIGVFDDLQKLRKRENAGLLPWQKLLLQTATVIFLLAMLHMEGALVTRVALPFSSLVIELGALFYPIALFVALGIINCANLTDGIDGLATSVGALIGTFFAVEGLGSAPASLAVLGAAEAGSSLAFFTHNRHPARIFMGDSGSLFLGAIAVGGAYLLGNPLLVLIFGLLYVVEGFSVVLQVLYFKLTHKRLFKMAPLHHHFEKCGWSEGAIVSLFSFFTLLAILLAHGLIAALT